MPEVYKLDPSPARGFRDWLRRRMARAGYIVFNTRLSRPYARDGLFTAHSDRFRDDPRFQAAYARGLRAAHGVDPQTEWRVHVALWTARHALRVPGDFIECGVNAGFLSSAILHHLDWARIPRTYFLIDTFAGPVLDQFSPAETAAGRRSAVSDALLRGAYVTDLDRVRANFAEWPNALILQGAVPAVLDSVPSREVAFLHLDMNCALPERAALEYFWPRLAPGGFVLLDDYAYFGNETLAASIDEAAAALGASVLALPTGQGLIAK